MFFKKKLIPKTPALLPNWDYSRLKKINVSLMPPLFIFTHNQIEYKFLSIHQLNLDSGVSIVKSNSDYQFKRSDDFFVKCFDQGVYTRPRPYCYYVEPEIYLAENGEMSLPPIFCCAEIIKNESLEHEANCISFCKVAWWQSHLGLPNSEILNVLADDKKAWAHFNAFTGMG